MSSEAEHKVVIVKILYNDDYDLAEDGSAEIVCGACNTKGWVIVDLTETTVIGTCGNEECDRDFEEKMP